MSTPDLVTLLFAFLFIFSIDARPLSLKLLDADVASHFDMVYSDCSSGPHVVWALLAGHYH